MKKMAQAMKTFYIVVFVLAWLSTALWGNVPFQEKPSSPFFIDNETIGMFNTIHDIAVRPQLDRLNWGSAGGLGGMGYYQRYILGFTAYGVSQTCEHTPAYRKPCIEALDGLIQKMLNRQVWEDWLKAKWGGKNPLHPYNIMYTGHLLLMMALYERQAGNGKYNKDAELIYDSQQKFETSFPKLAKDIAQLLLTNKDSKGKPYYMISCETNRVFVPCNSIPYYALRLAKPMLNLQPMPEQLWQQWVKDHMFDPKSGYFYEMFHPFDPEPKVVQKPSGLWTAWSLTFIHALQPQWAEKIYPLFKQHSVKEGAYGKGSAIMLTRPGKQDMADFLTSIFGMVLSREMGDQDLYEKLRKSFETLFGTPRWKKERWRYGYFARSFLRAAQNGMMLLARSITPDLTLGYALRHPRSAAFYQQPYVSNISNPKVFVNQAIWKSSENTLSLSINGGSATTTAPTILVSNVKKDAQISVQLDGAPYSSWTQKETALTIHGAKVGPVIQHYQVKIQ